MMNKEFELLDDSIQIITEMLIKNDFEIRNGSISNQKYVIDKFQLYKFSIKLLKLLIQINEMEGLE